MKRFILALILLQFFCTSYSQDPEKLWSVTYPEPDTNFIHIEKMVCDNAGNSYLTGYINKTDEDFITIKYNNNGIKLWTATYNSSNDSTDRATDIAVDASGNVYVTGRSIDGGTPNDYLTIKYNSAGVAQWTARFNGAGPYEYFSDNLIALDELGNIYVAGTNWGDNTQIWNYVTVKYNNNGAIIWSAHFDPGGSGNTDNPYAIKCDNSGSVIVTGRSLYDYTTVKYNSSGVEQWVAEESAGNGSPTGLDIDIFGNIYIIGISDGGDGGLRAIKYSPAGTKLWDVNYLSPGSPSDLEYHNSGYIYVTGSTGSFSESYCTLLKLSAASGGIVWYANHIQYTNGLYLSTDETGNIYVAARQRNPAYTENSTSILKYNSSGTELWSYNIETPAEELWKLPGSIGTDADGSVYLLIRNLLYPSSNGSGILKEDFEIIKYNSSGSQQWYSTPDFDSFNNLADLTIDLQGNTYVTGAVKRGGTDYDILTVKCDSSGNILWSEFYNGPIDSTDIPYDIFLDDNYNVYVTGSSQGSGTNNDYVTIKYNSSGAEQWTARYNGPPSYSDEAQKVKVDNAGNVFVTGNSLNADGNYDIATIKYNSIGQLQWIKRYNSSSNGLDITCGLEIDELGGIYVGGTSDSIGALYDYLVIKYNSAGDIIWQRRYNGPASDGDQAKAMSLSELGNIHITGWSVGNGTNIDYTTIKYNSAGVEQWVARWDDPANQIEEANAIAVDKNFNVYVTGFSPGAGTGEDFTTVKYNSAGMQQWVSHFNGQGSSADIGMFITLDGYNESYVLGQSGVDAAFIKYNAEGVLQSQLIYNPFSSEFTPAGISVDNFGNIYNGGTASSSNWSVWHISKYKQPGFVPLDVVEEIITPSDYILYQNYPNPFNPNTTIQFSIPEQSFVNLEVFNSLGEKVTELISEELSAGNYKYDWNAKNLTSGIYFYRFNTNNFSEMKKMVLLK